MNGTLGRYKYNGGFFNFCSTEHLNGTLLPNSFRMDHSDVDEACNKETIVKGTHLRWAGDHLVLRGRVKRTMRARGRRTSKGKESEWSCEVYFGVHNKKYYGEHDADFTRNKGNLVAYFKGLGITYRDKEDAEKRG